jgi:hypothetical protein
MAALWCETLLTCEKPHRGVAGQLPRGVLMTLPRLSRLLSRRRLPSRRLLRRPRSLAVMSLLLAPAVAACSGAAAEVHLPPKADAATAAAVPSQAPQAPRQQVVAALTGYVTALSQADRSRDTSAARQLLRPYLSASRIDGMIQTVSAIWARGESFYGSDELHILSVRVDGQHAFVHDCDNTSGMGLVDASGHPVPGSAGIPADNLVTRLDRTGGRWLVQFQLVEDVPCAP